MSDFKDLRSRIMPMVHAPGRKSDAINEFYKIVGSDPKKYALLNVAELYVDPRKLISLDDHREATWILSLLSEYIKNKPERFAGANPEALKFLARKFPMLYFKLFKKATFTFGRRPVKSTPREFAEIPYLKVAYKNVPKKVKSSFNEYLLEYYRLLKSRKEQQRD